jgi:hypothetical protein
MPSRQSIFDIHRLLAAVVSFLAVTGVVVPAIGLGVGVPGAGTETVRTDAVTGGADGDTSGK